MDKQLEQLAPIPASSRILLLPHCLRQSETCKATYNEEGLQCAKCNDQCSINRLSKAAYEYGYKGVCVAPGGKLAIKYIKTKVPSAIVAVACDKELEEGVNAVKDLSINVNPVIVIIPLTKDGCIDTMVNDAKALKAIRTGCVLVAPVNFIK